MNNIILYGNAVGFPITEKDSLERIYNKAQEMINNLNFSIKSNSESIISAELIIDTDMYLDKCTYRLTVYSCVEDGDLQQVDYDIKPGTDLYFEFKKYALKLLSEKLFPV